MKCADHDAEATDACSVCGRAMCAQCPKQAAPTRCQKCTVEQLMIPTRRQVDQSAGLALVKGLALLLLLGLLLAAGCSACMSHLGKSIHT